MRLSVIIPVYGVEKYVARCVRSLMEQTLCNGIEYIFVNDATPDTSMDIVKQIVSEYPNRLHEIIYLNHEVNKGLPAARNTGLEVAKGKYIYHCDSDDYIEPCMFENMLEAAESNNADMVWCDYFLTFRDNERRMRQPEAHSARQALSALLDGSLKYNVWNKIVKRNIYYDNEIKFPADCSMGEDMTMIKLAAKSRSVASINIPLYHYIKNNDAAMTQMYDSKKLSALLSNVKNVIEYLRIVVDDCRIEQELAWFCLNVKLPFLFTGCKKDIDLWQKLFIECNSEIFSNKTQSFRTRMLQWCAAKGMTLINRLYYSLIFNLFYGKIYR